MKIEGKEYRTIWFENNTVKIIDQTKLPHQFIIKELKTVKDAINSIKIEAADTIPLPFRFVKSATIKTVPAILKWCQLANISGLLFINQTPPPAYLNPTLSRLKPIIKTTTPVTKGGNI